MSATETLICRREMSLIESTSFGFAQNTIHKILVSYCRLSRKNKGENSTS